MDHLTHQLLIDIICKKRDLQFFDHQKQYLEHLINEHKLEGFIYHHRSIFPFFSYKEQDYSRVYRSQWSQNILFQQATYQFEEACHRHSVPPPRRIKGLDLTRWLLHPGERSLTDMDLFIDADYLNDYKKILSELNYRQLPLKKWAANSHKYSFIKASELKLTLHFELHTQLIMNESKNTTWNWTLRDQKPSLCDEDQALYLSYHWAYQHTFLKLFWLRDLLAICEKNPSLWNNNLFLKSRSLNIQRSVQITAWICYLLGVCDKPQIPRPSHLPTIDFLAAPMQKKLLYYWAKHYVKGSMAQNISYDIGWLFQKLF